MSCLSFDLTLLERFESMIALAIFLAFARDSFSISTEFKKKKIEERNCKEIKSLETLKFCV